MAVNTAGKMIRTPANILSPRSPELGRKAVFGEVGGEKGRLKLCMI